MSTSGMHTPLIATNHVSHNDAAKYNRRWLFVDNNNKAITNNEKLSDIQVDIKFGYLVLQAPGMMRLDIPLDVIEDDDDFSKVNINDKIVTAVDEGEVTAVWATTFLGQDARIVKVYPPEQDY